MKSTRAEEKTRDERRLIKYLARSLRAIAGLIILIAIIAHFWLVPAKFRREVKRSLMKFWDGEVNIEDIEVNYRGPIYLGRVSFFDGAGRECLNTGKVKLVFAEWPGTHPVLTEVEIDRLNLQIPFADRKITLPLVYHFGRTPRPRKKADIRKLIIKDAKVAVADTHGSETLHENLQLLVIKDANSYGFSLVRDDSAPSESLSANGWINSKTLEAELAFKIAHTVKSPEMALVFAALNVPAISADGKLAADLTMSGCLKQPATLQPKGTIKLDEWTVAKNDKTIVRNLTTQVNAKDGQFLFENLTAVVFNGSAIGSFYIESRQDGPAIFSGNILTWKMDFAELSSVIGGPGRKATRGSASFCYNFTGEGTDLQKLVGRGHIFLDDADITVIPVIPHLFRVVGLPQFDPTAMSDAGCTFTTAGPVVTFESAHVDNFFAAVKAEPGGTINLQTKQIDMYVVALALKHIDAVISRIPVVNIFANFKNRLLRFHIRGPWSEAPAKLIIKEPIKDIEKATVGFFQDVIQTGDWIAQPIRSRFGISPDAEEGRQPSN